MNDPIPLRPPRSSRARWVATSICLVALLLALGGAPAARAQDQVDAPLDPEIQYLLDIVAARKGTVARVTFSVQTTTPLKSLSVALDFEETRLKVTRVDLLAPRDGDSPVFLDSLTKIIYSSQDIEPGNQSTEGWIFAKLDSGDDTRDLGISTGKPVPVLAMEFLVRDTATLGFSPVTFENIEPKAAVNPDGVQAAYFNEAERFVDNAGAPQPVGLAEADLAGGGIQIIGEVGFFMRGDANFDLRRNITDPIATLDYLFRGGARLPCEDGADSNDDGALDLSDAVHTLVRLYVSEDPFPNPGDWGPDPTPDDLGCEANEL